MDFKEPKFLTIVISYGVSVLCLCFAWLTSFVVIPAGLGITVGSAVSCYIYIKKYKAYNSYIEDIKYQDAYAYADEKNDIKAIDQFSYPKKVERRLKAEKTQHYLRIAMTFLIGVLGIILFVCGIGMCF